MNGSRTNPEPTPEQLAALPDGELDPMTAERMEAWLANIPPWTRRKIHGQRKLMRVLASDPLRTNRCLPLGRLTFDRIDARVRPAPHRSPPVAPFTLWLVWGWRQPCLRLFS